MYIRAVSCGILVGVIMLLLWGCEHCWDVGVWRHMAWVEESDLLRDPLLYHLCLAAAEYTVVVQWWACLQSQWGARVLSPHCPAEKNRCITGRWRRWSEGEVTGRAGEKVVLWSVINNSILPSLLHLLLHHHPRCWSATALYHAQSLRHDFLFTTTCPHPQPHPLHCFTSF